MTPGVGGGTHGAMSNNRTNSRVDGATDTMSGTGTGDDHRRSGLSHGSHGMNKRKIGGLEFAKKGRGTAGKSGTLSHAMSAAGSGSGRRIGGKKGRGGNKEMVIMIKDTERKLKQEIEKKAKEMTEEQQAKVRDIINS